MMRLRNGLTISKISSVLFILLFWFISASKADEQNTALISGGIGFLTTTKVSSGILLPKLRFLTVRSGTISASPISEKQGIPLKADSQGTHLRELLFRLRLRGSSRDAFVLDGILFVDILHVLRRSQELDSLDAPRRNGEANCTSSFWHKIWKYL